MPSDLTFVSINMEPIFVLALKFAAAGLAVWAVWMAIKLTNRS